MPKILIGYSTFAGSTAEVAQAIGAELSMSDLQVDVLPLAEVRSLAGYDGVVVGGPMIMGFHRPALAFLKKHRQALQQIPVAVFVTAMSLIATGETSFEGVPVCVDEHLPKPPANEGRVSLSERYARLSNYLRPILAATRPAKPAGIAVFGGRLDYGRCPWWAVLFAMVIVRAPAGDRRNWAAIRSWASGLPVTLGLATAQPAT